MQMTPEQQDAFSTILGRLPPEQKETVLARIGQYFAMKNAAARPTGKSDEAIRLDADILKTEAEIESLRYRCTRCKNPERVRRMGARADRLAGEVKVMRNYADILARRAAGTDDDPDRDFFTNTDPDTFAKILAGLKERADQAEATLLSVREQLTACQDAPRRTELAAQAEKLEKELTTLRMHIDMFASRPPAAPAD